MRTRRNTLEIEEGKESGVVEKVVDDTTALIPEKVTLCRVCLLKYRNKKGGTLERREERK